MSEVARVWLVDRGVVAAKPRHLLKVPGHMVAGATFSPDSRYLACATIFESEAMDDMGGRVTVWDVVSGNRLWVSSDQRGYGWDVAFSASAQMLLEGAEYGARA